MSDVIEEQSYKGYTLELVCDADASDWRDIDLDDTPLIVLSYNSRQLQVYGDIDADLPSLTRDEVKALLRSDALPTLTGFSSLYALRREYPNGTIVDAVNDALREQFDYDSAKAQLDTLELIYLAKGYLHERRRVNGCCQGDWALVLAVATPAYEKRVGDPDPEQTVAHLKTTTAQFGHWAFGEIYGFDIRDSEGEIVASRGGYLGLSFELEEIIFEEARGEVDCLIEEAEMQRLRTLFWGGSVLSNAPRRVRVGVVNLSDIAGHPSLSLSPRDYLNENP